MAVGRGVRSRLRDLEVTLQPDFAGAWRRFCEGGPLPTHPKVQADIVQLLTQLVRIDRAGPMKDSRRSVDLLERALRGQRELEDAR